MSSDLLAIVVIGGGALDERVVTRVLATASGAHVLIAADSGLDHARAAGLVPAVVVGDMDSVSDAGLAWARTKGVELIAHPADKDRTDTELALAHAARLARRIVVLAGDGDRLDHTLGAVGALGHRSLADADVSGWWATTFVRALHGPASTRLAGPEGAIFSLLALHGECAGVDVRGARWPLSGARLEPGRSHALSNTISPAAGGARVCVAQGVLTVVVPDGLCLDPTHPLEDEE